MPNAFGALIERMDARDNRLSLRTNSLTAELRNGWIIRTGLFLMPTAGRA
jgi:hypothetical protein